MDCRQFVQKPWLEPTLEGEPGKDQPLPEKARLPELKEGFDSSLVPYKLTRTSAI